MKKVSIIILGFNKPKIIRKNIRIIKENQVEKEIILIDNGSSPPLEQFIHDEDIKIIRFNKGMSFSKAYNRIFPLIKTEYTLILNDDAFLINNALDKMIDFMERNKHITAVGPKLIDRNGSFQFQSRRGEQTPVSMVLYSLKLHKIFKKSPTIGRYPLTYINDNKPINVPALSGSCMLIRTDIIKKIGGFDETFNFFSEDLDLCKRLRDKGYLLYYLPHVSIIHYGSTSFKKKPFFFIKELHLSYLKYAKKHFSKNIFYRILYHAIILISFLIRSYKNLIAHR